MLLPFYFLVHLSVYAVSAEMQDSSSKYIQLTLGVSKAIYLPFEGERYLQNGFIMENPNLSSPEHDQPACSVGGWTAKSYVKQDTEVLMFTNSQQKLVVFGFRGTENLNDWEKNVQILFSQEAIGSHTVGIHKGFIARYDLISSWFESEYTQVPNDYNILITGHSLGGAEATIAAVYGAGKLNKNPHAVITYGSPKVGDSQFKDYYEQVVGCNRTIRMVSSSDHVPRSPLSFFGYIHVCSDVTVDGSTSSDVLYSHSLYGAYEDGIIKKFMNMDAINIGCDQTLA